MGVLSRISSRQRNGSRPSGCRRVGVSPRRRCRSRGDFPRRAIARRRTSSACTSRRRCRVSTRQRGAARLYREASDCVGRASGVESSRSLHRRQHAAAAPRRSQTIRFVDDCRPDAAGTGPFDGASRSRDECLGARDRTLGVPGRTPSITARLDEKPPPPNRTSGCNRLQSDVDRGRPASTSGPERGHRCH